MYVGITQHKKMLKALDKEGYNYLKSLSNTKIKLEDYKKLVDYYYKGE